MGEMRKQIREMTGQKNVLRQTVSALVAMSGGSIVVPSELMTRPFVLIADDVKGGVLLRVVDQPANVPVEELDESDVDEEDEDEV